MKKAALLSFRIDPDLKRQATRIAAANQQSFSKWLISLIAAQVALEESTASTVGARQKAGRVRLE